jgi:hypothetical protein
MTPPVVRHNAPINATAPHLNPIFFIVSSAFPAGIRVSLYAKAMQNIPPTPCIFDESVV